jgi:chromosome segregation ATPase
MAGQPEGIVPNVSRRNVMNKDIPMLVAETQSLDGLHGDVIRGEEGKVRIWYEIWNKIEQHDPEIERLSVEVEELESRRAAFANRKVLANKQRVAAEAAAEETRRHKRFKILMNKKKLNALKQRAAEMKEQASTMAKQERATADQLHTEQGRLMRLSQQRSSLYEVLRSITL